MGRTFLFSCFLNSSHRRGKHIPHIKTLNMKTEKEPPQKAYGFIQNFSIRESNLIKGSGPIQHLLNSLI